MSSHIMEIGNYEHARNVARSYATKRTGHGPGSGHGNVDMTVWRLNDADDRYAARTADSGAPLDEYPLALPVETYMVDGRVIAN